MTDLRLDQRGGIVTVTLNRPERHNSLTAEFLAEIGAVFEELGGQASCRVIILTGAGDSFCLGADVGQPGHEMEDMLGRPLGKLTSPEITQRIQWVGEIAAKILDCPKPVIAAVNGTAVGAGLNLMLLCDMAIAVESARFGA